MSAQEADAALKAVGLVGQPGDDVSDDKVDAGKVAAQNPAAGATAKAGDTVTYQLSKGPETTSVPSVVGMTQDQATKKLQDAGFTVTVKNADSDSVEKGKVISQSPSSGRAAKGSTVTITVSTGPSNSDNGGKGKSDGGNGPASSDPTNGTDGASP